MRRKDREITSRDEIESIMRSERVMHLALCDGNVPFVVPVFYAYDGVALYFHSARAGTKIDILKINSAVCFEIFTCYDVIESDLACDFEAKHRTVIGHGRAVFIEDAREKKKALDLIVGRFTNRTFEYPAANFDSTAVIRIDIAGLKGKMHGF